MTSVGDSDFEPEWLYPTGPVKRAMRERADLAISEAERQHERGRSELQQHMVQRGLTGTTVPEQHEVELERAHQRQVRDIEARYQESAKTGTPFMQPQQDYTGQVLGMAGQMVGQYGGQAVAGGGVRGTAAGAGTLGTAGSGYEGFSWGGGEGWWAGGGWASNVMSGIGGALWGHELGGMAQRRTDGRQLTPLARITPGPEGAYAGSLWGSSVGGLQGLATGGLPGAIIGSIAGGITGGLRGGGIY